MSGQNYIGSKISLISLSDIRYVGILHNINSAESTVALQNVQSFGTEGRKANLSEEIPTSDNIFDYVVFRGSDIKDLQVFEAPPSYKPAVSAVEPTVIQDTNSNMMQPSSNGNNSYYNTNSSSINQQYYAPPALPVTSTYSNYWQNNTTSYIQPQQAQQQYQFQPQQQQMRMPVPENYKKSTTSELEREKTSFVIAQDTSIAIEERKVPTSVISQEKQEVHVTAKESATTVKKDQTVKDKEKKKKEKEVDDEENIVDSLAKQVSDLDIKAPELSKVTQERIFKQQQQQQQQQQTLQKSTTSASSSNIIRNGNHSNNRNNNLSSAASGNAGNAHRDSTNNHQTRGGGSDRHRRRSSATRDLVVPRSDFDFASANAKFDKTEITLAAAANADENNSETVLIPEPEQFYNKEKSFFDDISCESNEYKKGIRGGGKYHEERKLNLETFGQANPNGGGSGNNAKGGNHRHRGGRGGRGGRGFHRGGSGGGKSNNKQLGPNKNQNGSNIESIA